MAGIANIGTALVTARKECGLTQRGLGELVGAKQQQIARWEATEYRGVSLARVQQVARALGVDLDEETTVAQLAAETRAGYATQAGTPPQAPVRDLAELVGRIREHGSELRARFGLQRLGVYGSFVSGRQQAHSDVDLLGELEVIDFDSELGAAVYLQDLLGRKVDFALPSELRPELRRRILDEVLYVWEA